MELSYIREFVVLAETGNYLEAADALFIAQSSLSRHIKSIELDLGSPLFDRTTRKVVLNGFGQAFLPYAKKMVEIQEEYENVLQSYLSGVSSTITVARFRPWSGTISPMCWLVLNRLIPDIS